MLSKTNTITHQANTIMSQHFLRGEGVGDWQQYFMSIIGETETGKNSQFQSLETVQMSEDTLKFTPFFFYKN